MFLKNFMPQKDSLEPEQDQELTTSPILINRIKKMVINGVTEERIKEHTPLEAVEQVLEEPVPALMLKSIGKEKMFEAAQAKTRLNNILAMQEAGEQELLTQEDISFLEAVQQGEVVAYQATFRDILVDARSQKQEAAQKHEDSLTEVITSALNIVKEKLQDPVRPPTFKDALSALRVTGVQPLKDMVVKQQQETTINNVDARSVHVHFDKDKLPTDGLVLNKKSEVVGMKGSLGTMDKRDLDALLTEYVENKEASHSSFAG